MDMLAGCRMTMDVEADGSLFIERLASAATLH
jgi:hypothetical protein